MQSEQYRSAYLLRGLVFLVSLRSLAMVLCNLAELPSSMASLNSFNTFKVSWFIDPRALLFRSRYDFMDSPFSGPGRSSKTKGSTISRICSAVNTASCHGVSSFTGDMGSHFLMDASVGKDGASNYGAPRRFLRIDDTVFISVHWYFTSNRNFGLEILRKWYDHGGCHYIANVPSQS